MTFQFFYVGVAWMAVVVFAVVVSAGIVGDVETLAVLFGLAFVVVVFMGFKFWRCRR